MHAEQMTLPATVREYKLLEVIGSGGFATVYRASHSRYIQFFAVKVSNDVGERAEAYEAEVSALTQLDHPNIIRIYDHFVENNLMYLVMELCQQGSIQKQIFPGRGIKKGILASNCRQMISALNYCHSQGIAHGDIKPSNIMIDDHGRIKLSDFGCSIQIKKDGLTNLFHGSHAFSAPEVLKGMEHNPIFSDIWSLGVTMSYMATGKSLWPLGSMENLMMALNSGIRPPISTGIRSLDDIIREMIVINPHDRISLEKVLNMAFMKENGIGSISTATIQIIKPVSVLSCRSNRPRPRNRYIKAATSSAGLPPVQHKPSKLGEL